MLKLARVFSDGMVLQRRMPILLWGVSDRAQSVTVRLDGERIAEAEVPAGDFALTLPAQEAREDAALEIGDFALRHVDVGEVWIAGGQSNNEFFLEYTEGDRQELACGISQVLTPVLDFSRDPRMGRQGEAYGEDPALAAAMGAAYTRGVQGSSVDGRRAESTAKHFLAFHNFKGRNPRRGQRYAVPPAAGGLREALSGLRLGERPAGDHALL